jgi:hypothetical protein
MECEFLLRKGSRRGECCGKTTGLKLDESRSKWYCARHYKGAPVIIREPTPVLPPDVLCVFDHLLTDDPETLTTTPEEQRRLETLRGYINYRIAGRPVFIAGHSLPMVYMGSREAPPRTHITKADFVTHLREAIDYINSRPDVYDNTLGYSTAEMVLKNITYDRYTGIFVANIVRS